MYGLTSLYFIIHSEVLGSRGFRALRRMPTYQVNPLDAQSSLMIGLQYSPLGVSVYAWERRPDGIYHKPKNAPGDTHWAVCYGYEDGKYWKIYDSYDKEALFGHGLDVLAYDWPLIGNVVWLATASYLSKNLFSTQDGRFAGIGPKA
jgi:hypothetical protein